MKKLLIVLLAVSLFSCSWFKSTVKDNKATAIDCSKEVIRSAASSLIPAMVGILTGGTDNWKDQAKTMGKSFGMDALACATKVAMQIIEHPVQSGSELDPEVVKQQSVARARALTIEQGWIYAE